MKSPRIDGCWAAVVLFFAALILLPACWNKLEFAKAFEGKFAPTENNRLINEYCQSCHVHRDFDPGPHVQKMQQLYKKKLYRSAEECRVCHYVIENNMYKEFFRGTRRPEEVNKGKFKDFEKSYTPEAKSK